jgi:hypothetical protein
MQTEGGGGVQSGWDSDLWCFVQMVQTFGSGNPHSSKSPIFSIQIPHRLASFSGLVIILAYAGEYSKGALEMNEEQAAETIMKQSNQK